MRTMSKIQLLVLALALVFMATLYSCPTRPPERAKIDQDRQEQATAIDLDKLLLRAKEIYSQEQLSPILALEQQLSAENVEEKQTELLKSISSEWNTLGDFALGGVYAEQVSGLLQSDAAFSIAGTTYFSCFKRDRDSLVRSFCMEKAIQSFESAISVAPEDQTHKVNLGLCYVEGGAQPMKGIMIIRDVAEKHPENALAGITLGKLSLRTGQYDKAIQRLETVLKTNPNQADAHYWLGLTYQAMNNNPQMTLHFKKFLSLSDDSARKSNVETILKQ